MNGYKIRTILRNCVCYIELAETLEGIMHAIPHSIFNRCYSNMKQVNKWECGKQFSSCCSLPYLINLNHLLKHLIHIVCLTCLLPSGNEHLH
nr:hypothetical protein Iba_scaffold34394CG0060 [Ipomoea batatas]